MDGIEDRGDTFIPTDVADTAAVEAEAAAKAAAEAEAAKATKADEEKDKPAGEEQTRGADGKFAKKDKDEGEEVRIPKSRFDEQVAKERERAESAERRLAALEAKLSAVEAKDQVDKGPSRVEVLEGAIDKLEEQRELAIIDGDAKKAAELRAQIRQANRELVRLEVSATSSEVVDSRTEAQTVDTVVENLMDAYPVLNSKSDTFNPRLVDLVLAEQARLINEKGMSPSQALLKAGTDTMELFSPKAAAKDETKDDGEEKAAAQKEARRLAALAAAVDASKKQPGSMKDTGLDSDKAGKDTIELDPNKLSFKEFNALPADQIARMRGDFV